MTVYVCKDPLYGSQAVIRLADEDELMSQIRDLLGEKADKRKFSKRDAIERLRRGLVARLEQQRAEPRIYWSTEEAKAAIRDSGEWLGHYDYKLMTYLSYVIWPDEKTVRYQLFRTEKGAEHLVIHYAYYYDTNIWISNDLAAKPDKSTSIMRQIDRDPAAGRDALTIAESSKYHLPDGGRDIDIDYDWAQDRNDNLDHKDLYYNAILIADQDGIYGS